MFTSTSNATLAAVGRAGAGASSANSRTYPSLPPGNLNGSSAFSFSKGAVGSSASAAAAGGSDRLRLETELDAHPKPNPDSGPSPNRGESARATSSSPTPFPSIKLPCPSPGAGPSDVERSCPLGPEDTAPAPVADRARTESTELIGDTRSPSEAEDVTVELDVHAVVIVRVES